MFESIILGELKLRADSDLYENWSVYLICLDLECVAVHEEWVEDIK